MPLLHSKIGETCVMLTPSMQCIHPHHGIPPPLQLIYKLDRESEKLGSATTPSSAQPQPQDSKKLNFWVHEFSLWKVSWYRIWIRMCDLFFLLWILLRWLWHVLKNVSVQSALRWRPKCSLVQIGGTARAVVGVKANLKRTSAFIAKEEKRN